MYLYFMFYESIYLTDRKYSLSKEMKKRLKQTNWDEVNKTVQRKKMLLISGEITYRSLKLSYTCTCISVFYISVLCLFWINMILKWVYIWFHICPYTYIIVFCMYMYLFPDIWVHVYVFFIFVSFTEITDLYYM